jgi:predicted small secreted protein
MKGLFAMKMIVTAISCAMLLASCSTVEGFGRDISGGARTIQGWF